MPMAVRLKIAFKLRQYCWRAISPNLMLAKVTHYTVCYSLTAMLNFVLIIPGAMQLTRILSGASS